MGTLILMRGYPGSGKSYLAKEKQGELGKICSADDFFMVGGEYQWKPHLLKDAHAQCREKAQSYMQDGAKLVIIDNTNMTYADMKPYIDMADQYGYTIEFAYPSQVWSWDVVECAVRNVHKVPLESIQKMAARYQCHNKVEKEAGRKFIMA